MSNQIQAQTAKVWQTITDPATANSYKQVVVVTWNIIRETAVLVWLILCLVVVLGDWLWRNSYRAGRNVRNWVTHFKQPDPNQLFSTTGQRLLESGRTSVDRAIAAARSQIGIERLPELPEAPIEVEAAAVEPAAVAESAVAIADPPIVENAAQSDPSTDDPMV